MLTLNFYVAGTCDIIRQRMKRFLTCFVALACFSPAAFATDGAVTPSRLIPGTNEKSSSPVAMSNGVDGVGGVTATATMSEGASPSVVSRSATRTVTNVPTTVRSGVRTVNISDSAQSSGSSARSTGVVSSRGGAASRVSAGSDITGNIRTGLDARVNTVGRSARTEAASINNNPAIRRAGIVLRPTTAEVGGRAHIAGTDIQTGSNFAFGVRGVSSRAATTKTATAETVKEAQERLEQTASLNKSCQEQYNDCMDQFCAVIDSNQKRCSCSANLSKYTKVETAVKDANTQLNEVAQRIRYVGLSADEIRAIMTATEAENALTGTTDTTETRNMLDEIEKLIKDPKSTTSYSDTYTGLDMDLDFTSDSSDLFNLDFLNMNTSSFSNLRGTELYSAAKKRCNTILTQCKEVGATSQQITGNYDLAIDKDCIAYEQGLTKMNETLVSNVRSANRMLQKARLAVLQNKNQYDAKGCISALDTCMTDDMVCGDDYSKCLDPTKTYIDENGKVVLGQNITNITAFMQNYNNANINTEFLETASGVSINTDTCKSSQYSDGTCIVKYLLKKIGTKQKVTDEGLCRAVLDKCQAYTYDSNGKYKPYNDVVVNYVQRAMVNVKAAQQQIISDYASSCMVDIASCYNQQVTQVNAWSSTASVASVYNVMRGACRNVALTCAYAVFAKDTTSCPSGNDEKCINSISEMFYQSLLCPTNSIYQATEGSVGTNGYVNSRCKCNVGYEPYSGQCLPACGSNETRNSYGTCACISGYSKVNGVCVQNASGGSTGESTSGGSTSGS